MKMLKLLGRLVQFKTWVYPSPCNENGSCNSTSMFKHMFLPPPTKQNILVSSGTWLVLFEKS